MVVVLRKHAIAYFPTRKVATTTIVNGLKSLCDEAADYRATYNDPMSARQKWLARGCFKFAVVRDPVARILSCYGNRVVHHRDLTASAIDRAVLRAFGRNPEPDLDEFCTNLWPYWILNDKIRRHTRLQRDYLGRDLGYFDAIYKISELDRLATDLAARSGREVRFERLQTGGPKFTFADLSPAARTALLRFTRKDYEFLSAYFSPPEI